MPKPDTEVRTMADWERELDVLILHPDGFDQEDWQGEAPPKMSRNEFEKRLIMSVCLFGQRYIFTRDA